MLKIYNTLTRNKDVFVPSKAPQVRMYVCGVTVYDDCHLGHARSALVFDVIRNYLRACGYEVTYVRNFTDVDDKIITRATKEGVSWTEIVGRYLSAYDRDIVRVGVAPADIQPKATDHVAEMIQLIERLTATGHAYSIDGDVYFDVGSYPSYGRLSRRGTEELMAGARVEVDERKKNPMDFALWKSSKPGEPSWDSPWGPGRPGWHIECSAMSMRYLGETLDIHGGGMDLMFPHHENEIAQSSAATGKDFARYWIHNGFVQINQEKMSKSLGNFFTIREVFEKSGYSEPVTGESLRYFLLTTHYRSPLEFSDQGLWEAKQALNGFYGVFQRLEEVTVSTGQTTSEFDEVLASVNVMFRQAMDDDFNTPAAIAQLQRLRVETNKMLDRGMLSHRQSQQVLEAFRRLGGILNLFHLPVKEWEFGSGGARGVHPHAVRTDQEIEALIDERNRARRNKDFARADEIRGSLASEGIIIEDRPDGTTRWKR